MIDGSKIERSAILEFLCLLQRVEQSTSVLINVYTEFQACTETGTDRSNISTESTVINTGVKNVAIQNSLFVCVHTQQLCLSLQIMKIWLKFYINSEFIW
jgi:hypothetical protein